MAALVPGSLIVERFRIERYAASGGMAEVYRAHDLQKGEPVAVKVMRRSSPPGHDERFAREARVLAELRHPGIVRHVASGRTLEGDPFLVMEWLEGEDLRSRLRQGRVGLEEALRLATRVAAALAAAHARHVVHRDIKPANLFLVGGAVDVVKVLDFGIARPEDARDPLTATGDLVGTAGYMAPEQLARGDAVDARVDVYALGVVVHECLTGELPGGRHPTAPPPPALDELVPGLPPSVAALVARMLAPDPAERPEHGAALLEALLGLGDPTGLGGARAGHELGRGEKRVHSVVFARRIQDRTHGATTPIGTAALEPDRAVIEAHGGRLVHLADGSALAVFVGAPVATDQATQAARCALALRALEPDVPLAIVTGRVPTGRSLTGEPGLRATGLLDAMPGTVGIRVDEITAGLLAQRFELVGDLGGLVLGAEREVADVPRLLLGQPTPFVGRERELTVLEAALRGCIDGGSSTAVLVIAAAGMGKSRLRHELIARVGDGAQVWTARGTPLGAGAPYALIADTIRHEAGVVAGDPPGAQQGKLRARVARRVAPDRVDHVSAFLGELAGVAFPALPLLAAARRDPSVMASEVRRAWDDWLQAETGARPVLLVLEDLHWGDAPSLRLLETSLASERRLMVLGLARPEVRTAFPGLWESAGRHEIHLSGLGRRASETLVRHALAAPAPAVVARIVDLAAGNAFFLEELIRGVVDGVALPETVVAMLQSRLGAAPPEARLLLRAASVFGEAFWLGGVQALLGATLAPDEVRRWLEALAAEEVVEVHGASRLRGEPEWGFRHALLQNAAYGLLTDEDRALGHRLAGAWLEGAGEHNAAVLATHAERGGELLRAAALLGRASASAHALLAVDEADAHHRHAIQLLDRLPDGDEALRLRLALLLGYQDVAAHRMQVREYGVALERIEPEARRLGDPGLLGRLLSYLAFTRWSFGRLEESVAFEQRAIALLEQAGLCAEAGYAWVGFIMGQTCLGHFAEAVAALEPARRDLAREPDARVEVLLPCVALLALIELGRWSEAIALGDAAITAAERSLCPTLVVSAATHAALAHAAGGSAERAQACAELAAKQACSPADGLNAALARAAVELRLGRPGEVVPIYAAVLPPLRAAGFVGLEWFSGTLLEAYIRLGQHASAKRAARDLIALIGRGGMRPRVGLAERALGEVALATAPEDAGAHFERALAIALATGAEPEVARCHFGLARTAARLADLGAARRHAEAALAIHERLGTPDAPAEVRAFLEDPGRSG
jgi:tetratricopeptide (TPR) repeat protein